MKLEKALTKLKELQEKRYALNAAYSALYLDAVTVAPEDTAEGRGIALGILAGEQQKLLSSKKTKKLLEALEDYRNDLTLEQKKQTELLSREYKRMKVIPAEEYMEYAALTNDAEAVWHKAKEEDNFEMFLPYLEKLVDFNRRFAGYYDPQKAPYDALLNEYERGVDMQYLDAFFDKLKEKLVPLLQQIANAEVIENDFLHGYFPKEKQMEFSDYLMEVMKIDRKHCQIGETEHPFTLEFNNKDVRITTNYQERDVCASMYSVIHEGGHALYELGIDDRYQYTFLTGGVSMGIHESQSRFYENLIGRSREFLAFIYPKMCEIFPEQFDGVTVEQLYRAVNKVMPSLIRIDADELTYCFHIMIRYEIEKRLIDGSLQPRDVPEEWNRLYRDYLGIEVPNDQKGCLQDSHWSGGLFGYFPSYALGSAYGAQMLVEMNKEFSVSDAVTKGELDRVNDWLKEKIHRYGSYLEPQEVLANAVGVFEPDHYIDYLYKKYSEIYSLNR